MIHVVVLTDWSSHLASDEGLQSVESDSRAGWTITDSRVSRVTAAARVNSEIHPPAVPKTDGSNGTDAAGIRVRDRSRERILTS